MKQCFAIRHAGTGGFIAVLAVDDVSASSDSIREALVWQALHDAGLSPWDHEFTRLVELERAEGLLVKAGNYYWRRFERMADTYHRILETGA